jgi:hypothetical protein
MIALFGVVCGYCNYNLFKTNHFIPIFTGSLNCKKMLEVTRDMMNHILDDCTNH